MEVISIDHYVNWQVAKSQLVDLHKTTMEALRICDVAMQSGEYLSTNDELTSKLLSIVDLTNEQVEQLSSAYVDAVTDVCACAETILTGEINREVN